ncbi:MAG: hypothetical protein WBI17_09520 [Clostridiaceae bacterium]
MFTKKYSSEQLDEAYESLSDQQKRFLDKEVIRGKKTNWLNVWAKKLGRELSENEMNNPDQSMLKYLEWRLIGYKDSQMVNPNTKCECGRALRYQYTIENIKTKKTYKLGIKHLQDHTGLSPELVKSISKGLEIIDLEKDEILTKVIDGWVLPFEIPSRLEITPDIINQLVIGLPLLERQVARLRKLIYGSEKPRTKFKTRPRFRFEPIKDKSIEIDKTPDLTNADPHLLFERLRTATINISEAKALLEFIKRHNTEELKHHQLSLDDIGKSATRALARISNPAIRGVLIDIEDFVQYSSY